MGLIFPKAAAEVDYLINPTLSGDFSLRFAPDGAFFDIGRLFDFLVKLPSSFYLDSTVLYPVGGLRATFDVIGRLSSLMETTLVMTRFVAEG